MELLATNVEKTIFSTTDNAFTCLQEKRKVIYSWKLADLYSNKSLKSNYKKENACE